MTGPFVVICDDGRVRHDGDFVHRVDAQHFAEWGHCCTSTHTITTRDELVGASQ